MSKERYRLREELRSGAEVLIAFVSFSVLLLLSLLSLEVTEELGPQEWILLGVAVVFLGGWMSGIGRAATVPRVVPVGKQFIVISLLLLVMSLGIYEYELERFGKLFSIIPTGIAMGVLNRVLVKIRFHIPDDRATDVESE